MKRSTRIGRFLSASLIAALLAALAGCGATSGGATSGGATAEQAAPSAGEPAALYPLTVMTGASRISAGDGCFYGAVRTENGTFGGVIDAATGVQRILCGKPGCAHTDESCGGWMYGNPSAYGDTGLLCDGDKLYWIQDGRYNESATAYIDVSGLDGRDRTRLAEGDALPDLHGMDFYSDGSSLYFCGYRRAFGRVDGGTGAVTLLNTEVGVIDLAKDYPETTYTALGLWDGKLLMARAGEQAEPDSAGAMQSDEAMRAYLDAWNTAAADRVDSLYTLDAAGTLTPLDYSYRSGDALCRLAADGRLYEISAAAGALEAADPATGERTTLIPDLLPENTESATLNGPLAGRLILNLSIRNPDTGELIEKVMALTPDTGEVCTLESSWFYNRPRAPVLFAGNDDALLLMVGDTSETRTGVDDAGLPATGTRTTSQFAVIPTGDYLSGSTDWTVCALLGELY